MTATLAAVLCVTGVSFSASAVEPRHEHDLLCINDHSYSHYEFVGEESVCYKRYYYCIQVCRFDYCGYTEAVKTYSETVTTHDWSKSSTCAACGYKHPTDIDSANTETHTH